MQIQDIQLGQAIQADFMDPENYQQDIQLKHI